MKLDTPSLMKKIFVSFLFLIFSLTFVSAQVVRKYSNAFLDIGVGARGLAMSGAQVASVNDLTAAYWNPAGLLRIKTDNQISVMHTEYFAGIAKYDYAGYAHKIDSSSALAFSLIRFGVDNIPNTTQLVDASGNINYDNITSFSVADYAFLFTYAKKLPIDGLTAGANAKIIYRRVGEFAHAWGFGLDAGLQYKKNNFMLGAMAKDITSTFNAWTYTLSPEVKNTFEKTGNEIPQNGLELTLPTLTLGAAYQFTLFQRFYLTPEVDFNLTFDGKRNTLFKSDVVSLDPYVGIELSYLKYVFLRFGIGNIQHKEEIQNIDYLAVQPNFGVGVKYKFVSLGYALTNIGNKLYSNVFSLQFEFNQIGNGGSK